MKKTLLLVALLVAASVTVASAAGINLSWGNKCFADGEVSSLNWACTNNTFTGAKMTCSFAIAASKTNFVATDLYLEAVTNDAGTLIPDWWKLGAGECRANNIGIVTDASIATGGGCVDPWGSGTVGGGGIGLYSDDTNRAHLNASWASPDPIALDGGVETFAAQFKVLAAKTTGTGACAGCLTPLTWALNYIQVAYQGEASSEVLSTPIAGGVQCLTYQGGTAPCSRPVPARNSTWGQVKSLYR